jgi:hypothetical protein
MSIGFFIKNFPNLRSKQNVENNDNIKLRCNRSDFLCVFVSLWLDLWI